MKHIILFLSFFILTLGTVSAQSRFDQDKSISIYPNPASVSFTIKFDSPSKITAVSVYSIIGNEVMNKKNEGNNEKLNFNIQSLKKGKYIVRVFNTDGSTETLSLIKN